MTKALYNDIWEALKQKGKCKIAAHPALHKRIVHAVVNKKYSDDAFKFLLAEENKRCIMYHTKTKTTLEFKLTYITELKDLTEGDI